MSADAQRLSSRLAARVEAIALIFVVPFLSELKISWAFAAAPLYFRQEAWPLWFFGATIGGATLFRVPMNALLTGVGDWLIAPILMLAVAGAVHMLMAPQSLSAVMIGIAAGHVTDTAQVQASLCYRWSLSEPGAQKRALRLQAFSATFGYSSGALLGGALFEYTGFVGCARLQLALLGVMAITTALMPVVRAAFRETCQSSACHGVSASTSPPGGSPAEQPDSRPPATTHSAAEPLAEPLAPSAAKSGAPGAADAAHGLAPTVEDRATEELTIWGTTRCLLLPLSILWLCDGMNILAYITEWTLFAVYFAEAYAWSSSTLTGAAQMAGDLLAAAILALTTTKLWARLLRAAGATRALDRSILQPPWNLGVFFAAYAATFAMLAQPAFVVSVIGQVLMGTVYVFNKQAILECYVSVSHGSLSLFRKIEFVGSMSFNLCMAAASLLAVLAYELISITAPFYFVSALSGVWAVVVVGYFWLRLRGRMGESFAAAELSLLKERISRTERTATGTTITRSRVHLYSVSTK